MRHLILAVAAMAGSVAWADDPMPVSDRAKRQVAAGLVDKLGSRDFHERQAAEKKLVAFGMFAFGEVMAGLSNETPEVAIRCERILPKLGKARVRE